MGALSVAAVRQRVAAVVEALASPAAWHESRTSYDLLPQSEPGQDAHLSFAVGAARTQFGELEGSRRRLAEGAGVTTTIGIRWLYGSRGDNQVADYDGALAAEAVLVAALLSTSQADLHLRVIDASRRSAGDGTWLLGEVTCQALHQYALQ